MKLREPEVLRGVARHAPIPPGREAHRTDLRPVGGSRPLELGKEEAFDEDVEPSAKNHGRVLSGEGFGRQEQDLPRPRPEPHEAPQEEIVELVGPDFVLRPLAHSSTWGWRN